MKTIHHVVDIAAPVDTVWAALTEVEGLTGWWGTWLRPTTTAVGARLHWTFVEGFNVVMEITALDAPRELGWRCVAGHDPWQDNTFRFQLAGLDDGRTRLRFWQDYAVELDDDASARPVSANVFSRPHERVAHSRLRAVETAQQYREMRA